MLIWPQKNFFICFEVARAYVEDELGVQFDKNLGKIFVGEIDTTSPFLGKLPRYCEIVRFNGRKYFKRKHIYRAVGTVTFEYTNEQVIFY